MRSQREMTFVILIPKRLYKIEIKMQLVKLKTFLIGRRAALTCDFAQSIDVFYIFLFKQVE